MRETDDILDNFALDVRARSQASLEHALAIAVKANSGGKVMGWCETPKFGLVLFSTMSQKEFHGAPIHQFPTGLDAASATAMVWGWLQAADRGKFQLEGFDRHTSDSGDAVSEPAWRAYVEEWGHVGGSSSSAIVAILPVWAWLGK